MFIERSASRSTSYPTGWNNLHDNAGSVEFFIVRSDYSVSKNQVLPMPGQLQLYYFSRFLAGKTTPKKTPRFLSEDAIKLPRSFLSPANVKRRRFPCESQPRTLLKFSNELSIANDWSSTGFPIKKKKKKINERLNQIIRQRFH